MASIGGNYRRLPITRKRSKKVWVIRSSSYREFEDNSREYGKNSFYCTVNILITFNYRNVKWKLKDTSIFIYKTECKVTKHSLNRACVLLFWEEKVLHVSLWQSTSASTSKLYSYNTSIGNPKFNVSDVRGRLFSRLFKGSKRGSSYQG